MENRHETVMGYPPDHFPSTHGNPVYGQPTTTAATAAAAATPPSTNTDRPLAAQLRDYFNEERRMVLKICCGGVLGLIIVAIVTVVVVWTLIIHRPKFQVDAVSVSPFNISTSSLNASWNIVFFVQNPNIFHRISYERADASVLYHRVSLSSTSLTPFYQDERDKRSVLVSFVTLSLPIDKPIAAEIGLDRQRGAVNFTVIVDGTVRVNSGTFEGGRQHMKVSCENVEVGFSSNSTFGRLLGGSRGCKVNLKF